MYTLDSGIDVPPWINVAKTINIAPWIRVASLKITDNLMFLYIKEKSIWKDKNVNKHTPFNKHVATGKKPKN